MYTTLKADGMSSSWDVSEAALYIMTAVAKDLSWQVASEISVAEHWASHNMCS